MSVLLAFFVSGGFSASCCGAQTIQLSPSLHTEAPRQESSHPLVVGAIIVGTLQRRERSMGQSHLQLVQCEWRE